MDNGYFVYYEPFSDGVFNIRLEIHIDGTIINKGYICSDCTLCSSLRGEKVFFTSFLDAEVCSLEVVRILKKPSVFKRMLAERNGKKIAEL